MEKVLDSGLKKVGLIFHGHTTPYSDGVSWTSQVVAEAARIQKRDGLDCLYFGKSEHENVWGFDVLVDEIVKVNDQGANLVPVLASEIRPNQTDDLVVFKVGQAAKSDRIFLEHLASSPDKYNYPQAIWAACQSGFNVMIVHPGSTGNAISIPRLDALTRRLPDCIRGQVAVEVENTYTNVEWGLKHLNQTLSTQIADREGLTKFWQPDYHADWMIGKAYTVMDLPDTCPRTVLDGLKVGLTQPLRDQFTFKDRMALYKIGFATRFGLTPKYVRTDLLP